MPGSIPIAAIANEQTINTVPGIIIRSIKDNCLGRSESPIRPLLSKNILIAYACIAAEYITVIPIVPARVGIRSSYSKRKLRPAKLRLRRLGLIIFNTFSRYSERSEKSLAGRCAFL